MTATGCACQFRAPSERPESTHCGRFPHDTGWTAVDPKRPLVPPEGWGRCCFRTGYFDLFFRDQQYAVTGLSPNLSRNHRENAVTPQNPVVARDVDSPKP